MTPATTQAPTLIDQAEQPQGTAVVVRRKDDASGLILMFERLATNPDVDVAKLERLIAMQERILQHNAEAAFNSAFAEMQAQIPTIIEHARTDKTSYAPLEDIIEGVRPVLMAHGFSISFRTEWPEKSVVKVIGILTHREGHARTSEFVAGADQTGSKNAIQALGSTVQYGRRYTTKDLLCIVTRGEDDDGERTSKPAKAEPDGFEDWYDDLVAVADEGWGRLSGAWNNAKQEYRTYLNSTTPQKWEALKKTAEKVSAAARAQDKAARS